MSFPKYQHYHRSGAAWIGNIPAHWRTARLKTFARFGGGGTPPREVPAYWGGDIPWVSPKDMKAEAINSAEECISEVGLNACASEMHPAGSVLMVVRSGILKHTIPIAINAVPVAVNQDMKVLVLDPRVCTPAFLCRLVQGQNDQLLTVWRKQGATVESIEHAYLADTLLPLPPLVEQAAINAFLDRETAKIDALVAEQEKLIELLQEKRKAVISQAVTKGLEPNVPMKDSGVEWLGEVPAHWNVSPFKWQIERNDGGVWGDDPDGEQDTIVLRSTEQTVDGRWQMADPAVRKLSESEKASALLSEGDLVVTKSSGSSLHIGKTTIVSKEIAELGCCYSNFMQRVRTKPGFMPKLAWYLMNNDTARLQFDLLSNSTTGLANLNGTMIGQVLVAVPPADEQQAIINFLDIEADKIDSLNAKAISAIDLLQERRSALVSAAVTGQIDVRQLEAT